MNCELVHFCNVEQMDCELVHFCNVEQMDCELVHFCNVEQMDCELVHIWSRADGLRAQRVFKIICRRAEICGLLLLN